MDNKPTVLVVGSLNMDVAVRTPRMPAPGETILGNNLVISPGGKGANQAVAVARMGARCIMIGRVGTDMFGSQILKGLQDEYIDCSSILTTENAPTGVAVIMVDSKGENSIVVASGANALLTPDDIFGHEKLFEQASVVVLQLETPMPTVRAAADMARRKGCKVILDPAPAPASKNLCSELCNVDILTPNASEAEHITGSKAVEERVDKAIAGDLIARGAKAAVLKLGARGALAVDAAGHFYTVPAYKVDVVDTTAAGDAFTGALAVAIASGMGLHEATQLAAAAGALACTKIGAQTAMPTAAEVKMLMHDQPR